MGLPANVALNVVLQVEVLLIPVTSVQVEGEKFPSTGAIVQLTVPVGEPLLPPISFTVAVHAVDPPTSSEVLRQATDVEVLSLASVKVVCA